MALFCQYKSLLWFSTPMKVIKPGTLTKRVISLYAEPGGEWIAVRDIGVQIIPHNIVAEGKITPVSLLLHIDNHYTQQSTLELFIPWSGLPTAMMHGAFLGMVDEMIYFVLFLLSRPCLYIFRRVHINCRISSRRKHLCQMWPKSDWFYQPFAYAAHFSVLLPHLYHRSL